MKKFIITNTSKYSYTLVDEDNNIYKLNLELIDVNYQLQVNDILYLNNNIINNHNLYTFGSLNSKYGKDLSNIKEDVLIIDNHKEKIYLKRIYG